MAMRLRPITLFSLPEHFCCCFLSIPDECSSSCNPSRRPVPVPIRRGRRIFIAFCVHRHWFFLCCTQEFVISPEGVVVDPSLLSLAQKPRAAGKAGRQRKTLIYSQASASSALPCFPSLLRAFLVSSSLLP